MTPEMLDRLLLDRALGVLGPEACALLSAYLERDAEAARRATEFETATMLARRALGASATTELPPFPAAAIERVQRTQRRLVLVRNVAALAACVLIGVGVGNWTARESPRPASPIQLTPAGPAATYVTGGPATESNSGFWSAQRLYEESASKKRKPSMRLEWDSPLQRPKTAYQNPAREGGAMWPGTGVPGSVRRFTLGGAT